MRAIDLTGAERDRVGRDLARDPMAGSLHQWTDQTGEIGKRAKEPYLVERHSKAQWIE
jgi:hypothetical protein